MIPPLLHFVWVGDDRLRPDACIRSWVDRHPDWTVKLWGMDDLRERSWVNARHLRELAAAGRWSAVADLMRWEILYEEGGVAVEADTVCLRPLEPAWLEERAFAAWEHEFARPGVLGTVVIGAQPDHPLIGQVILDLQATGTLPEAGERDLAGRQRFTDTWRAHPSGDLAVLPSHYFSPAHFSGPGYGGSGRVYCDHRWGTARKSYGEDLVPTIAEDHGSPRFTIGIVTWNQARYLDAAIDSALAQADTWDDFEVVVVDDGSTDETPQRLAARRDPRLRVVRTAHTNEPTARNRVLAEARGRWVVWLDSDDLLEPGTLAAYAARIARWPDLAVLYGELIAIDAEGREFRRLTSENLAGHPHLLARMFVRNALPNPGTCVNREAALAAGGYDESFTRSCDYDLWTRIAARGGRFQHVGATVARYRWHGANLSANGEATRQTDLRVMSKLLMAHDLRTLCSDLPWHREDEAAAAAIRRVGKLFAARGDAASAAEWLAEAERREAASHPAPIAGTALAPDLTARVRAALLA